MSEKHCAKTDHGAAALGSMRMTSNMILIASGMSLSTYAWFPSPIRDLTCCDKTGPAARLF